MNQCFRTATACVDFLILQQFNVHLLAPAACAVAPAPVNIGGLACKSALWRRELGWAMLQGCALVPDLLSSKKGALSFTDALALQERQ